MSIAPALVDLLSHHSDSEHLYLIARKLDKLLACTPDTSTWKKLITLYQQAIPVIEDMLWENKFEQPSLSQYQAIFRELETFISMAGNDFRYEFMVIIPVADRPKQLRTCLNSLFELCESYGYGGKTRNGYVKISALIADDSMHNINIEQNKKLTNEFTQKGIKTEYFGLNEQLQQVKKLKPSESNTIFGDLNEAIFSHKGASVTRNIAYLRLREIANNNNHILFYFIDSDQEFKVNTLDRPNSKNIGLNYFYYIDALFSNNDIKLLTGKVVGDPPVSPAVMANNFLIDVIMFLTTLKAYSPEEICQFHLGTKFKDSDAAYHDMAKLFGFKKETKEHHFQCPLSQPHSNADCLHYFTELASHFFDGEHPTRRLTYHHEDVTDSLQSARTVYTGNYVFSAEMLEYFIPFSSLKLRMAGPVLGRILSNKIGQQFVSANLPMLHNRTRNETGKSEFRPGVQHHNDHVNIETEIERQFFGDIMLFTIEKLITYDFPSTEMKTSLIEEVITSIEEEIMLLYKKQHANLVENIDRLNCLLEDNEFWWTKTSKSNIAISKLRSVFSNMKSNFGLESRINNRIFDPDIRLKYRKYMIQAILAYPAAKYSWLNTIKAVKS